jgi:septal ring factor EnvC (AmiA/AmiB activator)
MTGLDSLTKTTTHDTPLIETGQKTPINADKRVGKIAADAAVKKKSMNYFPNSVDLSKKDSKAILKGVMMALGLPLLLPYLGCHALVAAFSNMKNEKKIEAKNTFRDDLIDKKQKLETELNRLGKLQDQGDKKLGELEEKVRSRQKIIQDATNDMWGEEILEPKNKQTTEPKDPNHVTANDLKTDYDKYSYVETTKNIYEVAVKNQKNSMSEINTQIKSLKNELSIVDGKLKTVNEELEVPDKSPFQALEAYTQELKKLPPEEQKEQVLKGLNAGKDLIKYLQSNGKLDSNRAEGLLEMNNNYSEQVKNGTDLNLVKNYLNGLLTL